MPSQQQISNTPKHIRDRLATPDYLYDWLCQFYKFDIDLAAEETTAKCQQYYSDKDSAFKHSWHREGATGFCNPPYSDIEPWLHKAIAESIMGFTTVMVLPTMNGQAYWEMIARYASIVINVIGRVNFIIPEDYTVGGMEYHAGDELPANTRGTCVVVFLADRHSLETYYMKREHIYEGHIHLEARAGKCGGFIEPITNTPTGEGWER